MENLTTKQIEILKDDAQRLVELLNNASCADEIKACAADIYVVANNSDFE